MADKRRGRPFEPGHPGGPGRPAGSRNRASLAADALLDGEAEELTRKCIELAKTGDTTALRLCMERIAPVRKGPITRLPSERRVALDDLSSNLWFTVGARLR